MPVHLIRFGDKIELSEAVAKAGCDMKSLPYFENRREMLQLCVTDVPAPAASSIKQEMLARGGDAAVLGEHCVMPEIAVEEDGKGAFEDYATVIVEDTENCPRYCARVIDEVKIGPSPKWMREYLYGAGVRPINNIVDITNFVMLETGQPMHAFDLSKVRDQTIVVRRARQGETLTTLDGKEHVLDDTMLVIADHENATGLAGIMGGEESEIVEGTVRVLFESAAFDRANNRVTARKLGMRTEASGRFEKGVCAAGSMEALERACMLVNMLGCGKVVPGAYDNYPHPIEPRVVEASVKRICGLNGVSVPGERMEDILNDLNIDTVLAGDVLTCEVPAWRQDIETEADIAELDEYEERQMFLEEIGLKESGVARLIKAAYKLLDLQTFFTTGADESRAWTFRRGMKAPQTAGIIHTDFERGFIRAEVIKYDDYVTLGSEKACRDVGKIGIEGKEYVVQDGDIMHFLFNV